MKNTILVIILIVLVSLVIGCSSNFVSKPETTNSASSPSGVSNKPTSGLVQSNNEGNVTIVMEWDKTEKDSLVFNVTMDTHSVDLDKYNLDELVILSDDKGNEYRPISWNSPPGGHHRSGTLIFPMPDSVSQGKAEYIRMVIRDVAGIEERVLRWEW